VKKLCQVLVDEELSLKLFAFRKGEYSYARQGDDPTDGEIIEALLPSMKRYYR